MRFGRRQREQSEPAWPGAAVTAALLARPARDPAPAPVQALSQEQLREAVSGLSDRPRQLLWDRRRPAVELARRPSTRRDAPALGTTRLGGLPDLPEGTPWPTWQSPTGERPMMFFAQVDLGPVAGHLDLALPVGGLLLVFCDYDTEGDGPGVMGMYAEDVDAVRVLHAPVGAPLVRMGPPAPVELVTEALCVPLLTWTLPGVEGVLDAEDEEEAYDALDELDGLLRDLLDQAAPDGYAFGGHHRLGGHARPVQRPVELDLVAALGSDHDGSEVPVDADPAECVLLLQVDEDEGLGIWFGDSGTLYWLAHRDDLAAGDLTKVRFVYQCM